MKNTSTQTARRSFCDYLGCGASDSNRGLFIRVLPIIIMAAVLMFFAACSKAPGTKTEADQHSANQRAITAFYDAKEKTAEKADAGLIATVKKERLVAEAEENARHEVVQANLDEAKKNADAREAVKQAQAKAETAQKEAAKTAAQQPMPKVTTTTTVTQDAPKPQQP